MSSSIGCRWFPGLGACASMFDSFRRSCGLVLDMLQVWCDRALHNMNVAMVLVDVFHRVWELCRRQLAT